MTTAPKHPWAPFASAVLALVGLVDAIYLTVVKWGFASDPSFDGGMCGVGGGCDRLQHSVMADLPIGGGLPISILAVGFYLVWLVLLFMRSRGPSEGERALTLGRVMLGLTLLANAYDLVLLVYALAVGEFCPFCAVLYVVNAGLLVVTLMTLPERFGDFVKHALSAVATRVSLVALVVFLVAVGAGFAVYRATLSGAVVDKPPEPDPTAKVHRFQTSGRAERGPANARIRIVEFADFECPHCRVLFHTLEEVVRQYPDDVHLTFLHFPLDKACNREVPQDFHQRACDFATIAECARRQGRFFEAAGVLFDAGGTERGTLLDALTAVGVKRAELDQCLADPAALTAVKGDIEQGITAGIQGTPAVFMNGIEVGGARPLEFFEAIIDKHLAATARTP
ncbi:MAG: thioredoxin domain-containing protein [Deltaproteobacteria bacterium]|nr:thioredoxin domain-containing protein [Deltaproteobacteria bacterium]